MRSRIYVANDFLIGRTDQRAAEAEWLRGLAILETTLEAIAKHMLPGELFKLENMGLAGLATGTFAKGGFVGPGKFGLMGENGPSAIVPRKRKAKP